MNSKLLCACAAAFFTEKNEEFTVDAVTDCKNLIRKSRTDFNGGKGFPLLPVAALIGSHGNPEKNLSDAKHAYVVLRREYFHSANLVFTAFLLSSFQKEHAFVPVVDAMHKITCSFRQRAPELLDLSNLVPYLFLGISGQNPDFCAEQAELCRRMLMREFYNEEAVKVASLILAMSSLPAWEKCERLVNLFDALIRARKRFGGDVSLGMLAAVSLEEGDTARVLIDLQRCMEKESFWGRSGMGQKERAFWAALLLSQDRGQIIGQENKDVPPPFVLLAGRASLACYLISGLRNGKIKKRFIRF